MDLCTSDRWRCRWCFRLKTLEQTSHWNVLTSPTPWTDDMCRLSLPPPLKIFEQIAQREELTSPTPWISDRWLLRLDFSVRVLGQKSHWNVSTSPSLWTICKCLFRLDFSASILPQTSHSYLRPSVLWTVPKCRFKWLSAVNFLPQTSHSCLGPSVLWTVLRCRLKWHFPVNFRPQTSHLCLASGCSGRGGALVLFCACAVSKWALIADWSRNFIWQRWHWTTGGHVWIKQRHVEFYMYTTWSKRKRHHDVHLLYVYWETLCIEYNTVYCTIYLTQDFTAKHACSCTIVWNGLWNSDTKKN